MSANPASSLYGAIDIGGTKIAVGLVTARGEVAVASQCATDAAAGPEPAFHRMATLLEQAQLRSGHTGVAIGVGCTGPVDPRTGRIGDVGLLPGWHDFPLTARLQERFGVPACLENDCDAAALAEAAFGAGQGCSRFLYLSVSTGIGAGFIVDGQVYRGAGGAHPELGHHAIDPSGPLCYCGAHGCWESLASGTAIASWYRSQTPGAPDIDAKVIFQRALDGNPLATQAVDRFARYLGIGIGNLITLFAPDCIAVGGGVMCSGASFLEAATARARSAARLIPTLPTLVQSTRLGQHAGLIGAAQAAYLISQGNTCPPA